METPPAGTYTLIGGDGRKYGPYPLATLQEWIREGRMVRSTPVQAAGETNWVEAGALTGLHWPAPLVPTAGNPGAGRGAEAPGVPGMDPGSAGMVRHAASWFYVIAGLSAVNIGAALAGSSWRWIFGMTVTDLLMELGHAANVPGLRWGSVAICAGLLLFLAGMGRLAAGGRRWAFLIGMLAYAGDAALTAWAGQWINLAFHAYALFALGRGFVAAGRRG